MQLSFFNESQERSKIHACYADSFFTSNVHRTKLIMCDYCVFLLLLLRRIGVWSGNLIGWSYILGNLISWANEWSPIYVMFVVLLYSYLFNLWFWWCVVSFFYYHQEHHYLWLWEFWMVWQFGPRRIWTSLLEFEVNYWPINVIPISSSYILLEKSYRCEILDTP